MSSAPPRTPPTEGRDPLRVALASQYCAVLAMLRSAVEGCPRDLWYDDSPTNAFWQIAYHALFFTHFYLQPNPEAFTPWEGHQSEVQHEDGLTGPEDPKSTRPLLPMPYSREQVLAYCDFCEGMLEEALAALDLESADSGFYWYAMPRVEHQIVNLRHTQHHVAQLADRLRNSADIATPWVGGRPSVGAGEE